MPYDWIFLFIWKAALASDVLLIRIWLNVCNGIFHTQKIKSYVNSERRVSERVNISISSPHWDQRKKQDNHTFMYTKKKHAKFQRDFQKMWWDSRGMITHNMKITFSEELKKNLCNFSHEYEFFFYYIFKINENWCQIIHI